MSNPGMAFLALAGGLLVAIACAEVGLRLQPFVDLGPRDFSDRYSEVVHHRFGADGEYAAASHGECREGASELTFLGLGDSWMEDGAMISTLADEIVARAIAPACIRVCNAGASSYAPSLYLLKARLVFDDCSPDVVIVNIDATDIGDEWHRYRIPQVRDPRTSRLVGVRMSHDAHDLALYRGMELAHSRGLYLMRAAEKAYHLYLFMPRFNRLTGIGPWSYEVIMELHRVRDPGPVHLSQIQYFRNILRETLSELSEMVGTPQRVVVTYHPHFLGASPVPHENEYTDLLAALLHEVSSQLGLVLVDATGKLERIHGRNYDRVFRWPDDPFSHLTDDGYRNYGRFVASEIWPLVEPLL